MGRGAKQIKASSGGISDGAPASSKKVDRNNPEIKTALISSPVYRKNVEIGARKASAGEEIQTILKDGRVETTNRADEGAWIVTNPSGEEYIVSGDKFETKYQATEKAGRFRSRGYVRAIQNPYRENISIEASWGEEQHGDQSCFFAVGCDADGNIEGDPYIIDSRTFHETYVSA